MKLACRNLGAGMALHPGDGSAQLALLLRQAGGSEGGFCVFLKVVAPETGRPADGLGAYGRVDLFARFGLGKEVKYTSKSKDGARPFAVPAREQANLVVSIGMMFAAEDVE